MHGRRRRTRGAIRTGFVVHRQLGKLAAALLLAALPAAILAQAAAPPAGKRIAISIDDLPLDSRKPLDMAATQALNQQLLRALQDEKAKAIGFVNEDKLLRPGGIDAGVAVLQAWLDAGMELGNHNFGHLGLGQASLAQVQDAVVKGEAITRWLAARNQAPLRYYRHPYNQTGRNEDERRAFEEFLQARGYTVAPFTIEHDDYLYACVYEQLQDTAQRRERDTVVEEYLAHLRESVAVFETMSSELFGRQIPQVLLLHANRLNAETLPRTLAALRGLGYRFVPLEDALRDEAYALPAAASGRFGPSWLARWARSKGVKLSVYGQPDPGGLTAQLAGKLCQ
nr:polysaccharide deacetylase family protein [Tahibacter harae]